MAPASNLTCVGPSDLVLLPVLLAHQDIWIWRPLTFGIVIGTVTMAGLTATSTSIYRSCGH